VNYNVEAFVYVCCNEFVNNITWWTVLDELFELILISGDTPSVLSSVVDSEGTPSRAKHSTLHPTIALPHIITVPPPDDLDVTNKPEEDSYQSPSPDHSATTEVTTPEYIATNNFRV
jgi:hypothetical protein